MPTDERLVKQYSGERAKDYDSTRVGSKRFEAENRAFDKLWDRCKPSSVFDLPVGTGRWLSKYVKEGVRAVGADASQDMLDRAAEKLEGLDGHQIDLIKGDAFDPAFLERLDTQFDLVACIRFLNWIPSDKVPAVVRNLDTVAGRNLLLGIGVWQGEHGTWKRFTAKLKVWWVNLERRRRGRWPEYVHDPAVLDPTLEELGWKEVERIPIFSKKGRDNCFVLYERK